LPEIHAGEEANQYLISPQNKLQEYYRKNISNNILTEHIAKNHKKK